MKKVLLDFGANVGQGFEELKSIYGNEYEYHLYEPNPKCYRKLVDKYGQLTNVKIFNKAVGIHDGHIDFYFLDDLDVGGTVVKGHNSLYRTEETMNKHTVSSANILTIISEFDIGDTLVMKLDVESSEYGILESLIENNLLSRFSKIYCEFHTRYMTEHFKADFLKRENFIRNKLNELSIPFQEWY